MRTEVHLARSSKEEIKALIRSLPSILSGRRMDSSGLHETFAAHLAKSLYEQIHDAFLVKSAGGTDSAGIKWKPLKRETIARRPVAYGTVTQLGIGGRGEKAFARRERGLLTASQNERWKKIFFANFIRLKHRVGEDEAKSIAAAMAWNILKSEGAQTKLAVLGNRKVPVLIDSGRLLGSLTPGKVSSSTYHPSDEQIYSLRGRILSLGSKVPYAVYQHATRPLWPKGTRLNPWIKQAAEDAKNVVLARIESLLRRRR